MNQDGLWQFVWFCEAVVSEGIWKHIAEEIEEGIRLIINLKRMFVCLIVANKTERIQFEIEKEL